MDETGRPWKLLPLSLVVIVLVATGSAGIASGLQPATPQDADTVAGDSSAISGPPVDGLLDGPLATDSAGQALATQNETIDADYTRMTVTLQPTGEAGWEIAYRQRLETDEEIQAFEDLQADIANDSAAYLDPFEERIGRLIADAENATGRTMSASNFTIETERSSQPQTEFGIVTYGFDWDGFAVAEGETIRAGDALERLFLEENQDLVFRWPAEYGIQSIEPDPSVTGDDHVTWQGRLSFGSDEPELVVTTGDTDGGGNDGGDGDSTDGSGTDGDGGSPLSQWGFIGIVVLLALLAVGAGYVYRSRDEDTPTATAETSESGGADASGAPPSENQTAELMSNEERIQQLLAARDGRMKQKELTEELDWSDARTSQVVGDMREAGEIETFRIGRENVLTLPDVDIDGSTTPDSDDDAD